MLKQLKTEITAVLKQADRKRYGFLEADGFLRETALHYSAEHLTAAKPDVIVRGEDIPQELVCGLFKEPLVHPGRQPGNHTLVGWPGSPGRRSREPFGAGVAFE